MLQHVSWNVGIAIYSLFKFPYILLSHWHQIPA